MSAADAPISIHLQERLGNQLWQYAVCRGIAEARGLPFHIPHPFEGHVLFPELSLGVEEDTSTQIVTEKGHWHIQRYDPTLFQVPPGTCLVGYFQTERYLRDIGVGKVRSWFDVDSLPSIDELLTSSPTCVINFRGGRDFANDVEVFLPAEYYQAAMAAIKQVEPEVRFLAVTNDVERASAFLPGVEVVRPPVQEAFALVARAPYVIIANSSFSWWGAWLNEEARFIVAPKYWLRYNVSTGWWSPSDSLTAKFTYVAPRTLEIQSALECALEIDPELNYADHYK